MCTARDGLGGPANRAAIFDHVLAQRDVPHRDLMAQRNILDHLDCADVLTLERHRAHLGAGPEVHDGDPDIIARLVH